MRRHLLFSVLVAFSTSVVPAHAQYPYPPFGAARIQVKPNNAEVYIDGYFVGSVDDFDGMFQRLHVEAGEHELQIHLEGYRTIREKVLIRPGGTLKVSYMMEPLQAGDTQEARPKPDPNSRRGTATPPPPYGPGQPADFGALALRVQPADAVVLVDGEEWKLPEGEDRFFVELPEGPHRVEVRKEGFRPYIRTVEIRRGRTTTLNVSLTAGGG